MYEALSDAIVVRRSCPPFTIYVGGIVKERDFLEVCILRVGVLGGLLRVYWVYT
jgi:hypothetical protein